jgi:hypothetical protein
MDVRQVTVVQTCLVGKQPLGLTFMGVRHCNVKEISICGEGVHR